MIDILKYIYSMHLYEMLFGIFLIFGCIFLVVGALNIRIEKGPIQTKYRSSKERCIIIALGVCFFGFIKEIYGCL